MFIDEAKIAGQLNHPNIAQIFDLGRVDESYFIALEYVSGKDLRTLWERMVALGEHGDVFMACHMVMKVCEALQYAHNKRNAAGNELNIVHRDISPQNILISYEGDVKIIDFGIAKAQGKSSQTQVGILKGKFSYMSPEQVRGLHVDHRADIFSLGIVLYELLTVTRLFLGESDFDTLEKIRKVEMSPPTLYNPHIPRELEDIVLKSLAKSPDERYQSGSELHDALEQFMRNQSSYYGTKDLATYMKGAFVAEIELERKKLDYYRTINIEFLGGEVQNDSSNTPQSDAWEKDMNVGRGMSNFNEISPAAEVRPEGPASIEEAFIGVEQGRHSTGNSPSRMQMTSSAPDILPEVAQEAGLDLDTPLDDEDDPTIEWDRFNLEELNADYQSAPSSVSPDLQASPARPTEVPEPAHVEVSKPVPPVRQGTPPSIVGSQSKRGSSAGLVVAILFLIGVIVLGGVMAVIFVPKYLDANKADLTFKITGAQAVDIIIDGHKVHSGGFEGGRVFIEDNEPGRHEITVKAQGREEVTDVLVLDSGKNYEIPVHLKVPTVKVSRTGFTLQLEPADAQISLNGEALDLTVPFTKEDLKPGNHKLLFKKEGFLEHVEEIALADGELKTLDIKLLPAKVSLKVSSIPTRSKVVVYELVDGQEGKRFLVKKSKSPLSLPDLNARNQYEIEVFREGYKSWRQTFKPGEKAVESIIAKLETSGEVAVNALDGEKNDKEVQREAELNRLAKKRREKEEKRKERLLAEKYKRDLEAKKKPENKATGSGFVAIISKPSPSWGSAQQ